MLCHPDGSPFDPDVATHRFERQTELCPGVIRIRFHDQRHTPHCCWRTARGKYVAERLGDTVEMVHETDGHVTPRMRAGAVRRLGELIVAPQRADGKNR